MHTHEPTCAEMELLLQADLDGELDAAAAAAVTHHIAHCEHCSSLQQRLLQLHAMLSGKSLREKPSAEFSAALREKLMPESAASLRMIEPSTKSSNAIKNIGLFSGGAALAASLLLTLMPDHSPTNPLMDSVVAEHVQSLQVDHLFDVASTDQHTVKPWFNGKLDFVPPVVDFVDEGFALVGGRLDYLAGRNVAALVYRHGPHPINLFVWPGEISASQPDCTQKSGYNICSWRKNALNYWAISDVSKDEMQKFVALWK